MMSITVRRRVGVVLLFLCGACGGASPTFPTATPPTPGTSPPPVTVTSFPPLSGPSRAFVFDRPLSYAVSDYTTKSRLVLYDNGAFVLQYSSLGDRGYRGGYSAADGVITFEWEGWSGAGPWGATGTIQGEALTIQYNMIMQMTDFEDAVYVQTR